LARMIAHRIVLSSSSSAGSPLRIWSLSSPSLKRAVIQVLQAEKLSSVKTGMASIVVFRIVGLIGSISTNVRVWFGSQRELMVERISTVNRIEIIIYCKTTKTRLIGQKNQ
jgi:hypothetical protein